MIRAALQAQRGFDYIGVEKPFAIGEGRMNHSELFCFHSPLGQSSKTVEMFHLAYEHPIKTETCSIR